MIELRNFQKEAVQRASGTPGFLVADSCGLGKTVVAIESVKAVRGDRTDFKALVVCPPSIVGQWASAIQAQDPKTPITVVGYVPYDFSKINGWVITTYYEVQKALILTQLTEVLWDIVVADEAHRIRNRNTVSSTMLKKLSYAHAIALTATPMEHGAQDLWSILNFVRPDLFPTYWSFILKNFETEETPYTRFGIVGLKNPEEFGTIVGPHMIQRTKEEVMEELPEKIIIPTFVPLLPKQEGIYSKIKEAEDIVVQVEDKEMLIQSVLVHLLRLQQLSSLPMLLDFDAPSAKIKWLFEFIEDHPHEPIAVFSRFRRVAEYVADVTNAAFVGGGLNDVERFVNCETNYASCVIADSLQGVDGLQRADHAVFIDQHWSATQMAQAIDRVHRMNIKSPKNIYLLYSTREDSLVSKALDEKWTEQELVNYFIRERLK